MASPAIHRTHSVRNWVYLDDIDDVIRQLTPVLEMARADHAANSGDGSAFSPAITTKDDRPVLIWHHVHTSNSHQGTLFIPPEVGGPENTEDEGEGEGDDGGTTHPMPGRFSIFGQPGFTMPLQKTTVETLRALIGDDLTGEQHEAPGDVADSALTFVHSARRSGKNTARLVEATNRANAMEASLRRAVELRESAMKGTYSHQQAKEAVIIEAGVIPNRIGRRGGFTVIGVNDTLGYRSPTIQELVDLYREHGLQRTGENIKELSTSDLVAPLLGHFENGCRCPEAGVPNGE